ncbi:MAG: hypothetical protein K0B08_07735 [Bacteroidales bacterium]|nr:hypothetical protein [Bacteroidales bacterium]
MPKKLTLIALFATISLGLFSQRSTLELTFTAENNGDYVQLDSIMVMNRTQGGETVTYWPDTTLPLEINQGDLLLYVGYATFSTVGIPEVNDDFSSFSVYQNYPNPMGDRCEISMYIPCAGKVHLMITDLQGRAVLLTDRQLDEGQHTFRFHPGGSNFYFLTACWNGVSRSIKMISTRRRDGMGCRLDYAGSQSGEPVLKNFLQVSDLIVRQSGILDTPGESTTYTFQFATNIPCPGMPTVEYEGLVYNTIQIFSQCWLKENLNVGVMINGNMQQSNNEIIEKYCYKNEPDSCAKYGGLYQWNEMMQYNTQQGARGICPPGWHIPTDEEWKVLEGAVDSQHGIGDNTWDDWDYRGYDVGTNLKTTCGWYGNGNGTDLYGFSVLPGGIQIDGLFLSIGRYGIWWTSTVGDYDGAWFRYLYYSDPEVYRHLTGKWSGSSVRCLRDQVYAPNIELTFTAVNNTTHVQVDSIKVMNRKQGDEAMLYGSDTTLILPIELLFTAGDELLYIGYANGLESGILDTPDESTTYTFQFATNIPCPGMPTVAYGGKVYNTIQIFSQCWLKENLNLGVMINGTMEQSNNGTIEKYCYENKQDSCTKYGGLYQWNEAMQYTTQPGAQGICPPGWHIPRDEEWKVLEGAADSQYGIDNNIWDNNGYRGYNAGTNLKNTSGWYFNGNGTDLYGFSGLPGGRRIDYWSRFDDVLEFSHWWSSKGSNLGIAWYRSLHYGSPGISRNFSHKVYGHSVRCLRNY